jgi:hypothetical protein
MGDEMLRYAGRDIRCGIHEVKQQDDYSKDGALSLDAGSREFSNMQGEEARPLSHRRRLQGADGAAEPVPHSSSWPGLAGHP